MTGSERQRWGRGRVFAQTQPIRAVRTLATGQYSQSVQEGRVFDAPTPAWADLSAPLERPPEADVANVYKRRQVTRRARWHRPELDGRISSRESTSSANGYGCWHAPQISLPS